MRDIINSIDDIKTWENIEKHIRYICRPCDDFIIFRKVEDNYILMSKTDIEEMKNNACKCYLLPSHCFRDISHNTSPFAFSGFHALPRYKIIDDLYRYKDDESIYKLLWFIGAIYEILENRYYKHWFNKCVNYDENFIEDILDHFLAICRNEVEKRLNILDYRYIFGGARKNFLPVESISYSYKYINKSLNISDINVIIDYISLIIQEVKTQYRMLVIYE